jgi:protein-tyrosine phosphatase
VIDIHCHILPEIDDGPSNITESIEMAKIAALDGITKIVATPHIKNTLHPVTAAYTF